MSFSRRDFLRGATAGVALSGLGRFTVLAEAQAPTVKIGTAVLGDYALAGPIIVGIEKGFFKEAGVNAEFVPFRGGPDMSKAIISGEILIGSGGSTDILVFREQGAPLKLIASTTDGNHFTLFVASSVTKLADLKGKSIGVTRVGATTWVFARMLAKQQGWDPERDVKIVPLGGVDAQLAALARGEIAGFIWGDGGAAFEMEGRGRLLMRLDSITPKWISQFAMASEDGIRKNPDAIRRSLRGIFRAIKFMKENTDEAARILSPKLGWSEAAIKRAHQNSGPLLPADGRFSLEAFKVMQDTLVDQGILKKRLPLEEHYTTEFVPVRV